MGSLKVSIIVSLCLLPCWFCVKQKRKVTEIQNNDGNVYVVDNFASPNHITALLEFISTVAAWDFNYVEAGDAAGKQTNPWNFHWIVPMPTSLKDNLKILNMTIKLAHHLTNNSDYVLAECFGSLSRFGDEPKIIEGSKKDPKDLLVVLHLSPYKGNKTCSELIFHDSKKEIFATAPSASGRLVAWFSSTGYFLRPPCSGSFIAGRLLFLRLKLKGQAHEEIQNGSLNLTPQKSDLVGLPSSNSKPLEISVGQHLTRKFYDRQGRIIAVFDGLFSTEELYGLRKLVLKPGGFSFNDHQSNEEDDYDNVSWMSAFKVNDILGTKVWDIVSELAYFLSGERGWYPYDVSNNVIERSFHTRIHEDCEGKEYEFTFLLYLNPSWNENMYGETIFLEDISGSRQEYETIVAVRPKFGRVCMFRNIISHSARPPSPDFDGARFTFAVKISRNRKIGISKMYREALENEESSDHEQLKEELHQATIGGGELKMTEDQLAQKYETFLKQQSAMYKQGQLEALKTLSRFRN